MNYSSPDIFVCVSDSEMINNAARPHLHTFKYLRTKRTEEVFPRFNVPIVLGLCSATSIVCILTNFPSGEPTKMYLVLFCSINSVRIIIQNAATYVVPRINSRLWHRPNKQTRGHICCCQDFGVNVRAPGGGASGHCCEDWGCHGTRKNDKRENTYEEQYQTAVVKTLEKIVHNKAVLVATTIRLIL